MEYVNYRQRPPEDPDLFFRQMEEKPDIFPGSLLSVHDYSRAARATEGMSPFIPRPIQRDAIRRWQTPTGMMEQFRWELIYKPREAGITTIAQAEMLRLATSYSNQLIDMIANKGDTSTSILARMAALMDSLPDWWFEYRNVERPTQRKGLGRTAIHFKNGSRIRALKTTASASRSEHLAFLFNDEIDHAKDKTVFYDIYESNQYAVRDSTMVLASTTLGAGYPLEVLWNGPMGDVLDKIFIPFTEVPGCTLETREFRLKAHPHNPWVVFREQPLSVEEGFTMASDHFFPPEIVRARLERLRADHAERPLFKGSLFIKGHEAFWVDNADGYWKIKHHPKDGRRYAIGVDASRGGIDYCCIKVRDWDTGEDQAILRVHKDPGEFAKDVLATALYYNWAYVVVENRGGGGIVLDRLNSFYGYPNLYRDMYVAADGATKTPRPGYSVHGQSKKRSLEAILEAIQLAPEAFHFEDELDEMIRFRRTESEKQVAGQTIRIREKTGAAQGFHDDTISADRVLLEVMRRHGCVIWKKKEIHLAVPEPDRGVLRMPTEEEEEAMMFPTGTNGPEIRWR